jgi:hypothetical protein
MRNYAGTVIMLVTTMVAAVGSYTINLRVSGERAEVEAFIEQHKGELEAKQRTSGETDATE